MAGVDKTGVLRWFVVFSRVCLPLFLWLLLVLAPFLEAAEWVPVLVSSSRESYSRPNDTYRVLIPASLPQERLRQLVLELDAIDVTDVLQRDGNYEIFTPPQPLEPGRHIFRLVEYKDDGSIEELGYWPVEVRQSSAYREAGFEALGNLSVDRRIAKRLDDVDSSPWHEEGNLSVSRAVLRGDHGRLQGSGDLILNSSEEMTANGQTLDLGEYLLSAGNDSAELNVGHQDLGFQSLILQDFRRRGVSGSVNLTGLRTRADAFVLGSQDVVGFGKRFVEDPVRGFTLETEPLKSTPKALYFSSAYLTGDGSSEGTSTGDLEASNAGNAWTFITDSQSLGDRLHLRGEYSTTRFDFDGPGGYDKEGDSAYSLLAAWQGAYDTESNRTWSVSAEKKQVGTFFRSLANPNLPRDKDLIRLAGNLQWGTITAQADSARETDNVADFDFLSTHRTYSHNLMLGYNPATDSGIGRWHKLGTQSYALTLNRTRMDTSKHAEGLNTDDTDNRTNLISMNAGYSYDRWSWGAMFSYSDFTDDTEMISDTDTRTWGLSADFQCGERLRLGPSVQVDKTRDRDYGIDSRTVIWGLTANAEILPEHLTGQVSFSLNRNKQSDDSVNNDIYSVNGGLDWIVRPAETNHPGFDVALNGVYQDTIDRSPYGLNSMEYQVFLYFNMTVPLAR